MSPNVANSLVHDLVEMAKAMEQLPQVQQELSEVNNHLISALDQVRDRELSIHALKQQIETLQASIRTVEAQRDDAEMRFLEGEDRTRAALDFIKSTFGSAGSLIQALEPPTPTPVAVQANAPAAVTTDAPTYYPERGDDGAKIQNFDAPSQDQRDVNPISASTVVSSSKTGSGSEVPAISASTVASPSTNPDPGPAIGSAFTFHGDPTNVDSVSVGERAVDPTLDAAASPASGPTPADTKVDAFDDVGYHNEPNVNADSGWSAWDAWADRMNKRYGHGSWPQRPAHHNYG